MTSLLPRPSGKHDDGTKDNKSPLPSRAIEKSAHEACEKISSDRSKRTKEEESKKTLSQKSMKFVETSKGTGAEELIGSIILAP